MSALSDRCHPSLQDVSVRFTDTVCLFAQRFLSLPHFPKFRDELFVFAGDQRLMALDLFILVPLQTEYGTLKDLRIQLCTFFPNAVVRYVH